MEGGVGATVKTEARQGAGEKAEGGTAR